MFKMLKDAWVSFTGPFRSRPPIRDWSHELLDPVEKQKLAETNRHIARTTARLKREIALMVRDHSGE